MKEETLHSIPAAKLASYGAFLGGLDTVLAETIEAWGMDVAEAPPVVQRLLAKFRERGAFAIVVEIDGDRYRVEVTK